MESSEVESIEDLAEAITSLSDAAERMLNAGLSERAIIILLHDMCKVNRNDIKAVLRALPELKNTYLQDGQD